ncbi:ABC transporter G member 26 [Sarracenia purpurea var. burkii]
MLDKVLVISEGYPVYYGKTGDSMDYFSSLQFVPDIPMNPADFLLDLATGQLHDIRLPQHIFPTAATHPHKLVIKYLQLKYKTLLEPKEKEENHHKAVAPEQLRAAVQVKKEWTISWWEQFTILAKRTFRERWRDYFDKLRLVQAIGVAVLLGLLWWNSKTGTEAQLRDQRRSSEASPSSGDFVLVIAVSLSSGSRLGSDLTMATRALSSNGLKANSMASHPKARAPTIKAIDFSELTFVDRPIEIAAAGIDVVDHLR